MFGSKEVGKGGFTRDSAVSPFPSSFGVNGGPIRAHSKAVAFLSVSLFCFSSYQERDREESEREIRPVSLKRERAREREKGKRVDCESGG